MDTLGQIIEKTYTAMGEGSDIEGYLTTATVIPKINDVVKRVCRGRVKNIMTGSMLQGGSLPFLHKTKIYPIIQRKSLTEKAQIDDTTLTLDTTGLGDEGAVMIDDQIVTYTDKTSTTITVEPLSYDISAGTTVNVLYSLPDDCDLPVSIKVNRKEVTHTSTIYQTYPTRYWAAVGGYIYIQGFTGNFLLQYQQKVSDMTDTDDKCVIQGYIDMIAKITGGEILYSNEEINNAEMQLNLGYSQLEEFYSYYARPIKGSSNGTIRPQPINTYHGMKTITYR